MHVYVFICKKQEPYWKPTVFLEEIKSTHENCALAFKFPQQYKERCTSWDLITWDPVWAPALGFLNPRGQRC